MTNNTLKQYAHTLRLSGLLSTLELRLKEAEASRRPYAQFLEIVFQDEINVREQRTIAQRHKAADFRELRSLDNLSDKQDCPRGAPSLHYHAGDSLDGQQGRQTPARVIQSPSRQKPCRFDLPWRSDS